ncbi:hypothetical protein GX586_16070 [bacterium]|nr:hypothetical protein [bacterium]
MKTLLALLSVCLLCALPVLAVDAPEDDYATAYGHGADTTPGLRALWDATPAVALLAKPNADAHTTNYVWEYVGTNYVCSTTNVVQNSKYAPLSWDTTTWPWANSSGIPYGIAIITNPPTYTYATVTSSGQVNTVVATITTNVLSIEVAIATVTTNAGGLLTGYTTMNVTNSTVTAYTTANVTNAPVLKATTILCSNIWINQTASSNGWRLVQ